MAWLRRAWAWLLYGKDSLPPAGIPPGPSPIRALAVGPLRSGRASGASFQPAFPTCATECRAIAALGASITGLEQRLERRFEQHELDHRTDRLYLHAFTAVVDKYMKQHDPDITPAGGTRKPGPGDMEG